MIPLPLSAQTLTWLTHAEQAGQSDAQVLLHLLNRVDANDQDVAKFLDYYSSFLGSYSKNIAALCRRLEALERAAGPIDARGYEGPTDEDLYSLAEQFHGDPVPAMRRALELWGNPLQGAPAPGENLATALGEADMDHVERLAAIIRKVDGNHSIGAAALAKAILERYPCAFLDAQHAAQSRWGDGLMAGVCVALAVVTAHDDATTWGEIVKSAGINNALNYAANVNSEEWELAGFGKYAQSELGQGKPYPAPQAGEVEA